MKTIMAKNPRDSFSFSRRYFHWKIKKIEEDNDREGILDWKVPEELDLAINSADTRRRKTTAVSKLRSAFSLGKTKSQSPLGARVVGTLFGFRRGHVHFAFQEGPNSGPVFLFELAIPTGVLVRELASGTVRIALECEKKTGDWKTGENKKWKEKKLLEECAWRTYCNGRKCGLAVRRECAEDERRILNSIGPITMGAGVLPGRFEDGDGPGPDGEVMYMRAKYERVVGSKDSEAFYMMNPDGHGGPELSIYLLRV